MNAAAWIERVYAGVPGTLVVSHQDAAGEFHGTGGQAETHEAAVQRIESLDAAGARGVYLRVTTVGRALAPHERGGASDAHALPGLWADVDFGETGHRHDPARHDGRPLPPDESEARRIVDTSGLPAPSLWVHSGGGLYPWWLLDDPVLVTDDNRVTLEALSSRWQEVLQSAAHRLGYEYGAGVGDLSRVLRVPGTTNRKGGQERPCRVVEDGGAVYSLAELVDALPSRPEPPRASPPPAGDPWSVLAGSESVLDRFAAEHPWGEVLARYGFTPCHARHGSNIAECFTRPGDPEHTCSAHVLTARPEVLVVWSESAGLPVGKGQKLTKARVVAHMEHGGDLSELARSLMPVTTLDPGPLSPAVAPEAGPGTTTTGGAAQPFGSTWRPVDLTETLAGLLDGTLTPPVPSVGAIEGGAALFYPGRVNGIHGDSNAGKTWSGLATAAQELAAGRCVVYIDLEDNPAGLVARLLAIGVTAEQIASGLVYIHAHERLDDVARAQLAELVTERAPSLVVIDSTGEGLALEGANPNADEEVARWFRRLPRTLADLGPAVVVLDHMVKSSDDGSLWPIGSQRKRAAITGAQYLQKVVRPFSRESEGYAVLVCAKDRNGHYRAGQRVAELHVTPTGDGSTVLALRVAEDSAQADGTFRPTGYMERVSRVLESAPEPLTYNELRERVTGKKEHIRQAVDVLVTEGYVTTERGARRATMHTLARPFREAAPAPLTVVPGPGDQSPEEVTPETGPTGPGPKGGARGTSGLTGPGDQSGTSGDQSRKGAVSTPGGEAPDHTCPGCSTPIPAHHARCGECASARVAELTGGNR